MTISEDLAIIIEKEQEAVNYLVSAGLMHVTHIIDGYRVWGMTPLMDKKKVQGTLTEKERQAMWELYG